MATDDEELFAAEAAALESAWPWGVNCNEWGPIVCISPSPFTPRGEYQLMRLRFQLEHNRDWLIERGRLELLVAKIAELEAAELANPSPALGGPAFERK